MKLKNKKTGEIVETVIVDHGAEWEMRNVYTDEDTQTYNSLAELNEEWEDYYEKGIQCIYYTNHFDAAKIDGVFVGFETKEEAEKAVEKLKAWKRLGNKGFRFTGYDTNYGHHRASFVFEKEAWATETEPDLDLLFGGEE